MRDILYFLNELEELYEHLKGSASFEPREEQLTFTLAAQSGGHIEVVGSAWSEARYGIKHEFCFFLDQTFSQHSLNDLRLLAVQLNQMPKNTHLYTPFGRGTRVPRAGVHGVMNQ